MWMVLPAICLAMVHISGNNVAIIPDMSEQLGNDIYITIILSYMILGMFISVITAWIGVKTEQDIVAISSSLYGKKGKTILAITLLAVSIPASALTGGYYGGEILHLFTGIPHWGGALLCLLFFSLLAGGYQQEVLKISNYIGLLLVPILIPLLLFYDFQVPCISFEWNQVNWILVLGLTSYNAGGLWSALAVETGTCLAQKGNKAIVVVVLAKLIEGMFTLYVAYIVLLLGAQGPLTLADAVSKTYGERIGNFFYFILFCTFVNVMAPAMLVNGRQVSSLTGLSFWISLGMAAFFIYIMSLIDVMQILMIMGYAGLFLIIFIMYTAYLIHKYRINK